MNASELSIGAIVYYGVHPVKITHIEPYGDDRAYVWFRYHTRDGERFNESHLGYTCSVHHVNSMMLSETLRPVNDAMRRKILA